jgi:pimeloyl-ACP methyl ester carboxylesterase
MGKLLYFLSAAAALATFSTASPVKTSNFNYDPPSKVDWQACEEGIRCANLSVPLDWSKPRGKQISIAMAMIPAANQEKRIGYLMVNPGGPGASSLNLISAGKDFLMSTPLHQYFDILGPGPRGTAGSTPVNCDPEPWNRRYPERPQTEAEFQEMLQVFHDRGESCVNQKDNDILYFVDTISVAKDLEAVRIALGDEKMNYIGFSYGTQLGAQYAELFPDNIRALVLDGIMDHSRSGPDLWGPESNGYEVTVNQFFDWCAKNNTCALHKVKDLPTKFDAFIDRANKSPIPAPSCLNKTSEVYPCFEDATGNEILRAFQTPICFPYPETGSVGGWVGLSELLQVAMYNNDSSAFSTTKYASTTGYDMSYAAIFCQDAPRSNWSAIDFKIKADVGAVATPHTRGIGEVWYLDALCMNWPTPVRNPPRSLAPAFASRNMSTPILLVNALYDPETPIQFALNVHRQLGEQNAHLIIRDGSGHTSYNHVGETHRAINKYLVDLEVPKTGAMYKD